MSEIWNNVAGAWERQADFIDAHHAEATAALLDAVQIGPGGALLEVAAGPGGVGIAAAAIVGDSGRVVIADIAPAMVEGAARRSAGLPQVSTLVCDQMTIDAPDESFDAVVARHGLMFAVPPEDAVREACRVLRPGGHYGAICWAARGSNPWLGHIFDAVGDQFGVEFPPPGATGPFALDDPDRLADVLRGGGLEDVRVEEVSAPMPADSLEDWWEGGVELAGPVAAALAALEPDVRQAIHDRAIAYGEAAARPTANGIEMDCSMLVGSGRRP